MKSGQQGQEYYLSFAKVGQFYRIWDKPLSILCIVWKWVGVTYLEEDTSFYGL
jgi:hypothetical protein